MIVEVSGAAENDLDVDAIGNLDPHELPEGTLVGVQVDEPLPSGLFLQGTLSFFVGRGTGPRMSTPVLWEIPLIWAQTLSTFAGSVPLREILARCDIVIP